MKYKAQLRAWLIDIVREAIRVERIAGERVIPKTSVAKASVAKAVKLGILATAIASDFESSYEKQERESIQAQEKYYESGL